MFFEGNSHCQLGRFLSVDPLFKSFPWYTRYQFAGNKPIAAIDLDGLEEYIVTYKIVDGKRVQLSKTNSRDAIEVNYSFIKSVLENTSEYIVGGDVSQFYENGMAPTTGVLTITIAEDGTPTLHYKYEAPKYDQGYGQTDGGNASRSHFKSTAKTRGSVDDIPLGSGGDSPAKLTFLNFVDRVSQIFQELLSPSGGSEVNEPVMNDAPLSESMDKKEYDYSKYKKSEDFDYPSNYGGNSGGEYVPGTDSSLYRHSQYYKDGKHAKTDTINTRTKRRPSTTQE